MICLPKHQWSLGVSHAIQMGSVDRHSGCPLHSGTTVWPTQVCSPRTRKVVENLSGVTIVGISLRVSRVPSDGPLKTNPVLAVGAVTLKTTCVATGKSGRRSRRTKRLLASSHFDTLGKSLFDAAKQTAPGREQVLALGVKKAMPSNVRGQGNERLDAVDAPYVRRARCSTWSTTWLARANFGTRERQKILLNDGVGCKSMPFKSPRESRYLSDDPRPNEF